MSLIDATYKTTKYNLPLFFETVRRNVGYKVVAHFVVQSETTEQILEALNMLKGWNPEWKPPFFLCDYSEAEISAIERAFPGITVYMCIYAIFIANKHGPEFTGDSVHQTDVPGTFNIIKASGGKHTVTFATEAQDEMPSCTLSLIHI